MPETSMRLHPLAATLLVAACTSGPPDVPPGAGTPPEPTTECAIVIEMAERVALPPEGVRAALEESPLIYHLTAEGGIAPPVADEVLVGDWPEPGAARRLTLADGHFVVERVLVNEPRLFRYQVYTLTNAAGRGVEQIVGEQRFVPDEGGTRFEWDYAVVPRGALARLFVRREADALEAYLSRGLASFAARASGG